MVFREWILTLENLGMLDVLLPFLLIFTVVYAVLQKTHILGPDSKRFNVILSFVMAMAAVIPHVLGVEPDVVVIINSALPSVSLLMIASLMALILIGVFGSEIEIAGTPLAGIVVFLSIAAVAWIFISSAGVAGNLPPWLQFNFNSDTRTLVVSILVFGAIVWFITAEERDPGQERVRLEDISNKWFGDIVKK